MSDLNPYKIDFSGLKNGNHKFNFNIDIKFFEGFKYFDFKDSELVVKLNFEKLDKTFKLSFESNGNVTVPCDLSMELYKMQITSKFNLIVKFGSNFCDENDEILIIPYGTHQIDISQFIFEMIILSIPLKKVHPGVIDGSLKSEILNKLKLLEPKQNNIQSENDPRWNKLKDLLKNN